MGLKQTTMLDSYDSLLKNNIRSNTRLDEYNKLTHLLVQLMPLHELRELIRRIQSFVPRYLGVESLTLYLYDSEQRALVTDIYEGVYEISESFLSLPDSTIQPLLKRCLLQKTPVALFDCSRSRDIVPEVIIFKGVQSVLFLPITVSERLYGVLQLEYLTHQHQFTDDEIRFYSVVAGVIAMALENSKKFQEQKQKQSLWRDTEDSYYRFFETVPIGLFRSTPDGVFLRVNPALVRILGFPSREALLAVPATSLYLNIEDRERWKAEIEKNGSHSDKEIQLRRADGTVIWVRHSATAIRSSEGTILYYDGAIADISEKREADKYLKEAYREKELLLKEIHHRVKNNLQIISSLLNLQSDYLRDPYDAELFKQSQARVKAMALLHEKLYQSPDLARIDFGAYLHSLVAHLFQSYTTSSVNIGYTIDADNIHFDIDTAIPCGLIVGELVSNCLKHAFVGRKEGHVWISVGHFDSRTIRLSVADNGVGMKEPSEGSVKSAALGLELVKTLSDQLAAVLDIQRVNGTRVTLLFKAK